MEFLKDRILRYIRILLLYVRMLYVLLLHLTKINICWHSWVSFILSSSSWLIHVLYIVINIGGKKLWQIWWITVIYQIFSPAFTISITFPMQMDFSSPKIFPPNFLQSLFTKLFLSPKFFYYMINIDTINVTIHVYSINKYSSIKLLNVLTIHLVTTIQNNYVCYAKQNGTKL